MHPCEPRKRFLQGKMYKDKFQNGFFSVLSSLDNSPLESWTYYVRQGHIKRITDSDLQSQVLELRVEEDTFIASPGLRHKDTFIASPGGHRHKSLAITLPYLVILLKNLKKYFTFQVDVLDDAGATRKLRASNFRSTVEVTPDLCHMPLRLELGWNQVTLNLDDLMKRAYGSSYVETTRLQINANCRLRRVYFMDRLYRDEDVPADLRLCPISDKDRASRCESLVTRAEPKDVEELPLSE
uniref:CFA20 domain-containing protein n=1 Tax=Timema genevievae TaxID=629358 RepID=A0A7R9PRD5_TIMGE|nr:unnamed protein product [Timema genevievae]